MKQNTLKQKLKSYPVALTGLALGVAGLGAALSNVFGNGVLFVGSTISAFFLIVILTKNLMYPLVLLEELKHPTVSSFVPTFDMALMIISSAIVHGHPFLGKTLWLLGIAIHLVCLGFFLKNRLRESSLDNMIPSWFVPPIGIVIAAITGSEMGFPFISQAIVYMGFAFYAILLPIMFYRVIFSNLIDDDRLPSFGIMAAPPNLCVAGYLTAFPEPNAVVLAVLVGLALFSTCLVYMSMIRIWKIKFSPIYASYTFPLAISSTAMIKVADYFNPINSEFYYFFRTISMIELIIATIVTPYIFVKMILWIYYNIHKVED